MDTQANDQRINSLKVATFGVVAGIVSWVVVPVASGKFEPYDSGVGMAVNQLVLSISFAIIFWRYRLLTALLFALGAYAGTNAYVYAFGGGDHRGFWMLGAVVSTSLFALPLIGGCAAAIIRKLRSRNSGT
jgi:hypothetical protein